MGTVLPYCLVFVMGFITGVTVKAVIFRRKSAGTLRIDTSDPDDPPLIFLELGESVTELCGENTVQLTVSTESYIAQK